MNLFSMHLVYWKIYMYNYYRYDFYHYSLEDPNYNPLPRAPKSSGPPLARLWAAMAVDGTLAWAREEGEAREGNTVRGKRPMESRASLAKLER